MSRKLDQKSRVRIVMLSDTHGFHREVDVPGGDLLIHAGDFTLFSRSVKAIEDFSDWLAEQPHKHRLVIPGNHEFFLEKAPDRRSLMGDATVLINEGVDIEGLRIWGSPVTPLYGGAFGLSSPMDRRRLYSQIPNHTDILVTHGPPYGILDVAPDSSVHAGCPELLDAVLRVRPRLHVFGHVHGAGGIFTSEHTTFVNAALPGIGADIERSPTVLDMPRI